MRFPSIFLVYCGFMGFMVGVLSALFLTTVNFFIHGIWTVIPTYFALGRYYPLLAGIVGGLLVGLLQTKVGDYPKTMHETLHEFKTNKTVPYKHRLLPSFISALVVLMFGASLGPEAALASILGGLISWLGNQMKWTLARKEELLELSMGAMVAAVFRAPLAGLADPLDQKLHNGVIKVKWKKLVLYGWTTIFGLLGYLVVQQLFPAETIFALHLPVINWDIRALLLILPAFILGTAFGYVFLVMEKISDSLALKLTSHYQRAIIGGILIGLFGMLSPYFLFSGEHQLMSLSQDYSKIGTLALVLLALGKALLTNACFAAGWRGGKIFPAIFASVAIGCALANLFPFMPGLLVGITVAASVTVILQQPIATAALLLFLLPVQLFPAVLLSCLGAHWVSKGLSQKFPVDSE